jgi:hypothetical protein
MLKIIAVGVLALSGLAATAATASAFERHVTVDTPRGTYSRDVDRYCFDGACYAEAQIMGPNGATLQRSGMCAYAGYHRWNCHGTVVGPRGNSVDRRVRVIVR